MTHTAAFAALGLTSDSGSEAIRKRWLSQAAEYRDCIRAVEDPYYSEVMMAYAALSEHGHEYGPEADWVAWTVDEIVHDDAPARALSAAMEIVDNTGLQPEPDVITGIASKLLREREMKVLPVQIDGRRMYTEPECYDVYALMREMITWDEIWVARGVGRCLPEAESADRDAAAAAVAAMVHVVWRTNTWTSRRSVMFGSMRVLARDERARWPGQGTAPLWEMMLNLPAWLCMTPERRRRLVHHELCHAGYDPAARKAGTLDHDVIENLDTLRRFGPASLNQIEAAEAVLMAPETRKLIEAAGWTSAGQGLLFALPKDEQ